MPTLTDDLRKTLWKQSMSEMSNNREPMALSKFELLDVFGLVDDNMDEVVEFLRSKITSKAQLALPERVWLRTIELVVGERQKSEEKADPPPAKAAELERAAQIAAAEAKK